MLAEASCADGRSVCAGNVADPVAFQRPWLRVLLNRPKVRASVPVDGVRVNEAGPGKTEKSVLLVAASDSMCCVRIPSLLARAGWRVTVMAPPTSLALASRYVARRLPVPGGGDSVLRRLRALHKGGATPFDWILLGDEDIVAALSARLEEPWAAACFPVLAGTDAARVISHKTSFIEACRRAGITVPLSRVCQRTDEAMSAAGEIGFPLLLKADFGASGTTIWRVDSRLELIAHLPSAAGRPFTLQRLLAGEAGVTEMLCEHGRPLAMVSSLMRGIDPVPFGPASSRLYRKTEQAEEIAARLAVLTGFHGFCGFDWIQCEGPDGPVHAIEFHARPTLGFHMARHGGVDFTLAARRLLEGHGGAPLLQPPGRQANCLFFPKDFTRTLRQRDVRGLLR
jgi:predicted ATP-grasp superfamily ATP-dependent carboligase